MEEEGVHGLSKAETGKLMWKVYGKDYDHINLESRALGLWLWDLRIIEGKKLQSALDIVQNSTISHCRKFQTEERWLKQDFYDAKKHIETMTY